MAEFIRPKISWTEWEREPMAVAQKVAMAIALHVEPENMTFEQRGIVFAWLYNGNGGRTHGEIFFNSLCSNDDGTVDDTSFRFIPEALETLGAKSHVEIFHRAVERWESKPRKYARYQPNPRNEVGDTERYAAWCREVFRPVCDEFLDLDEEAFHVKPSLESYIIAFLRKHRKEFVEITDG